MLVVVLDDAAPSNWMIIKNAFSLPVFEYSRNPRRRETEKSAMIKLLKEVLDNAE